MSRMCKFNLLPRICTKIAKRTNKLKRHILLGMLYEIPYQVSALSKIFYLLALKRIRGFDVSSFSSLFGVGSSLFRGVHSRVQETKCEFWSSGFGDCEKYRSVSCSSVEISLYFDIFIVSIFKDKDFLFYLFSSILSCLPSLQI